MATVTIEKPQLVFCAPVNELTSVWGVYAIPHMWKDENGDLVVFIGGNQDSAECKAFLPDLYFVSHDDGKTFSLDEGGEKTHPINIITGIGRPCATLKNGDVVFFEYDAEVGEITGINAVSEIIEPNGAGYEKFYRYADIPDGCKGVKFCRKTKDGVSKTPINFDFPERLVGVVSKANDGNGNFAPMREFLTPYIFRSPYLSSVTEGENGELFALTHGQNPEFTDKWNEEIYLLHSLDGGKTWAKKSTVASDPQSNAGFGGDGAEITLARTPDGVMLVAMRMELSTVGVEYDFSLKMARSTDDGKTWSKPYTVADSSVTPQVVALKNGKVLLFYGRPGVHFKVSEDGGATFGEAHTLIGKTLSEARALGVDDDTSKYWDMDSYSNVFVEPISDDSVLVCYSDMKYDNGDGKNHKATLVCKVTVK